MEAYNGMMSNTSDALLRKEKNGSAMRNCELLDMEEAKTQVLFSLPMTITNVCYYAIPLISVMFAGHLGQLQLASSNLANSWATVTGFSFMVGLSGALETLCGQGYGTMPNADITTSVIAMCVNTEDVAYMCICGLSASASTRVSNELGAGRYDQAKHAMKVTLKLSVILGVAIVLSLGFGHNIWAACFSNSSIIIENFASMTPLLAISLGVDSIQVILSGVASGCGWQHLVVYINLAMFYLIGMPIAIVLGFKLKLYAKGLWMGLICGLIGQAGGMLLLTRFGTWNKMELGKTIP